MRSLGTAALTLGLALLSSDQSRAQIIAPPTERNVVYLELGGPGGLYSLNYERLNASELYLRGGATTWSLTNVDRVREKVSAVIVGATRRFDVSELLGGGFTYRIMFTPLLPLINSSTAFPQSSPAVRGSFSAGYAFR